MNLVGTLFSIYFFILFFIFLFFYLFFIFLFFYSTLMVAGYDLSPAIYELPSELFDGLLMLLPPLALQKLQDEMSVG